MVLVEYQPTPFKTSSTNSVCAELRKPRQGSQDLTAGRSLASGRAGAQVVECAGYRRFRGSRAQGCGLSATHGACSEKGRSAADGSREDVPVPQEEYERQGRGCDDGVVAAGS